MERALTIKHREAAVYLLCEAAELEHGIMCSYLYAAFSLKESADEGLTPDQLAAVTRWRRAVFSVATQEMLHLALVNNVLVALGEAPHFSRPNLPDRGKHYPAKIQLSPIPFGEKALRHFLYLERPEGFETADAAEFEALSQALPVMATDDIAPYGQEFETVGHLYREISRGLTQLVEQFGEEWVFLGDPARQTGNVAFQWPELIPVTDLASARQALATIVDQGEGAQGDWKAGHYGQFLRILEEFLAFREADPSFTPARPVVPTRTRLPLDLVADHESVLVTDPLTYRVLDAFNVANELLLQTLSRFFGHSTETGPELAALADIAVTLMTGVLAPLGQAMGRLPVDADHPGVTAAPTFDLFYFDGYLLPQKSAAWTLLHERLYQLAAYVSETAEREGAPERLHDVVASLRSAASAVVAHVPALLHRFDDVAAPGRV